MRKGLFLVTLLTLITTIAFAQTRKINGTVLGENGAAVAGASIKKEQPVTQMVSSLLRFQLQENRFLLSIP